jgi:hypothetical protein
MELDNLKQTWQESSTISKPLNNKIMELIQSKSYGPLASLISKFKNHLLAIPLFIGLVIYQIITKPQVFENPSIWVLYSIGMVLSIYFVYNYLLASKLQNPSDAIKQNMELQIKKLESSFKWFRIAITVYYFLIPVALELALYFNIEKNFQEWGQVSIYIRALTYIAGFVFMILLSKRWFKREYGEHLQNLKRLIEQMK